MKWIFLVPAVVFFSTGPVSGSGFSDLNMGGLAHEMLREKKELTGSWQSGEKWKGFLCQGEYRYTAALEGKLADLKMEVVEEKTADIRAEFTLVRGNALGSYRTSKFLCIPFRVGVNFLIDRVSVYARAHLVDVGAVSKIKVSVVSTEFGSIRFGASQSPVLERFVTRLINVAFRWIWDSRIGTWINERISEEINNPSR